MKAALLSCLLLGAFCGSAQTGLLWSPDYELQLSDFRAPTTRVDSALTRITLMPGTHTEFGFRMSTYEYMATRNFNDKVSASFHRETAAVQAPDSATAARLVAYERYTFDLAELCARRVRREMYENKGVFSDFSMFEPIFQRHQREMELESARVHDATNFGEDQALLAEERGRVRAEIDALADYCRACKPAKRKRGRG